MDDFHSGQPIFIQIRQRLIDLVLKQAVGPGDALPSVRQIAADMSVNPLTVTKAFEALVDMQVVERRRGLGMFVKQGARETLLAHERETFLREEWPRILTRIEALELDLEKLLLKGSKS